MSPRLTLALALVLALTSCAAAPQSLVVITSSKYPLANLVWRNPYSTPRPYASMLRIIKMLSSTWLN